MRSFVPALGVVAVAACRRSAMTPIPPGYRMDVVSASGEILAGGTSQIVQ